MAKTEEARTLDPKFKYEVAGRPGGENIKSCFACGVCTAGCPVAEVEEAFNPRRIIRQVLLGLRDEVLSSDEIWYCITCFDCTYHCPQNVKFANVMGVLRDMAVEEGYVAPSFPGRVEETGRLVQEMRRDMVRLLLAGKTEEAPLDPAQLARAVKNLASGGE